MWRNYTFRLNFSLTVYIWIKFNHDVFDRLQFFFPILITVRLQKKKKKKKNNQKSNKQKQKQKKPHKKQRSCGPLFSLSLCWPIGIICNLSSFRFCFFLEIIKQKNVNETKQRLVSFYPVITKITTKRIKTLIDEN
jgi:hypothetical protein